MNETDQVDQLLPAPPPILGIEPGVDRVHYVISDTHGGHVLGLMLPGVTLYQEQFNSKTLETEVVEWEPEPNPLQAMLNSWYVEDLEFVEKLAAGRPITGHHNGDPTQGTKYPREWVSTREADQVLIAENNLRQGYLLSNMEAYYLTMGTGSHEMGEGSSTILIARMLQQRFPEIKTRISNHWLMSINDVEFDIAHHGPGPGSRKWLDANNLRWYVNDIMQRDVDRDRVPPAVVVRSHFHTIAMATSHYRKKTTFYTTQGVLTPGYTGLDFFARQATRSKNEVTVGIVVFEISAKGKVNIETNFRILDTRTREIIK